MRGRGLSASVSHLRTSVSQLEAHVRAMEALMSVVCDVVFKAGDDLRVAGSNPRLDATLGPIQGQRLDEKLLNDSQVLERFHMVVNPLLAAPPRSSADDVAQGAPNVVLVPPVSFHVPVDGGPPHAFDAEILVADTGFWHESSTEAWRFLVGLKGVVQRVPPLSVAEIVRDIPILGGSSSSSSSSHGHSMLPHLNAGLMPVPELSSLLSDDGFSITQMITIASGLVKLMRSWKVGPEPGSSLEALREGLSLLGSRNLQVEKFRDEQCLGCLSLFAKDT